MIYLGNLNMYPVDQRPKLLILDLTENYKFLLNYMPISKHNEKSYNQIAKIFEIIATSYIEKYINFFPGNYQIWFTDLGIELDANGMQLLYTHLNEVIRARINMFAKEISAIRSPIISSQNTGRSLFIVITERIL